MQLSAANLLLAAQQAARQPSPPRSPAFASALAAETRKQELFAPLDFKQTAPAPAATNAQPLPRAGATLDIRV